MRGHGAVGAIREIQVLFRDGTAAGLSDRQLLQRFAARGDESAFAALVGKHGPMVLGVCRRIVRDRHEAEDAFQAAFLVLARKAGSIRVDDSLGRWLYTVARRIALRAETGASRRGVAGVDLDRLAAPDDPGRDDRRELRATIDAELDRLPRPYRAVLGLCYLEGLSHEEAARRLRWPLGTVKGRLARARGLLRGRLARRGLGATTGALVALLRPASAPAALIEETVSAAVGFATGRGIVAGAFPAAVALARGTLGAMHMVRIKLAAAGLLAFGVVGVGMGRLPGAFPALAQEGAKVPARTEPAAPPKPKALDQEAALYLKMVQQDREDVKKLEAALAASKEKLHEAEVRLDEIERKRSQTPRKAATASATGRAVEPRVTTTPVEPAAKRFDRADAAIRQYDALIDQTRRDVAKSEAQARDSRDALETLQQKRQLVLTKRSEIASELVQEGKPVPPPDPGPRPAIEGQKRAYSDYVVEPPDLLIVEVLEALPGRPISGERLVRPDGKISLGFYGDVYVAGLTLAEVKAKVIEHLRKYLTDEVLGLVTMDDGEKVTPVAPADSTRVMVDVSAYNSKFYYVQGEVASIGRFPITGNETVLDAINFAGGPLPSADPKDIRLVRPAPPGARGDQALTIDLDAIVKRGDPSTNYQVMPGDRLIVARAAAPASPGGQDAQERRIEERLDALARELEGIRRDLKKAPEPGTDPLISDPTRRRPPERVQELRGKP